MKEKISEFEELYQAYGLAKQNTQIVLSQEEKHTVRHLAWSD
ncbi:hypothetical protein [Crocosphaera sp.]|nr:hypothetical protein [Crocosphaera sp.]